MISNSQRNNVSSNTLIFSLPSYTLLVSSNNKITFGTKRMSHSTVYCRSTGWVIDPALGEWLLPISSHYPRMSLAQLQLQNHILKHHSFNFPRYNGTEKWYVNSFLELFIYQLQQNISCIHIKAISFPHKDITSNPIPSGIRVYIQCYIQYSLDQLCNS